jgi:hypothetical protein
MIANDHQLHAAIDRIAKFQRQVFRLRQVEADPVNYHASASGFLAEIARMQLQVREYLSVHPSEVVQSN